MRTFKYKHDSDDPTKVAHDLVGEVEASLGVSLQVADPNNPNDVHGYINTSSDGTVEIHLYEAEDIQKIKSHPAKIVAHKNIHKVHPIKSSTVNSRLNSALVAQKGFKVVSE